MVISAGITVQIRQISAAVIVHDDSRRDDYDLNVPEGVNI